MSNLKELRKYVLKNCTELEKFGYEQISEDSIQLIIADCATNGIKVTANDIRPFMLREDKEDDS